MDIHSHLIDPRIGVLIREGRQIFYACINGEFPERATAHEVLDLLEGRESAPKAGIETILDSGDDVSEYDLQAVEKLGSKSKWRVFAINIKNLDITWEKDGVLKVRAKSRTTALKAIKRYMREEGHSGRYGCRYAYTFLPE